MSFFDVFKNNKTQDIDALSRKAADLKTKALLCSFRGFSGIVEALDKEVGNLPGLSYYIKDADIKTPVSSELFKLDVEFEYKGNSLTMGIVNFSKEIHRDYYCSSPERLYACICDVVGLAYYTLKEKYPNEN